LPTPESPRLAYAALTAGEPRRLGRVRATAFEVFHTVPAVGYVIQAEGAVLAFTGDTYAHDNIWNALNALPRLDYLAIEVSFAERESELGRLSRHFTPALLAQEIEKLRHRPRLLLSHHKPGSERVIAAECKAALAGWSIHHLRRGDTIDL
jgi:ribonuclease BN (tRNA processing enzyme)